MRYTYHKGEVNRFSLLIHDTTFYIIFGVAFSVILSMVLGIALTSYVSAYESSSTTVTKNASVTVSAACSFTAGGGAYSETVYGGYTAEIIANNIVTSCNDLNGYAVYAIGYSGDSYDSGTHTDMITNLGDSYNIKTAGNTYGSSWQMKIAPGINATIENDFDIYQNIPATFTKVAQYTANTNNGTITPSYKINVASSQPAGTYIGKVKYVLVHPNTMVAGTYTINYLANGGSGTMTNSTVTGLYNFESQTLAENGYTAPSGYQFAGWCTVQDQTASGVVSGAGPQTTCTGNSYAASGILSASPSTSATANGTMNLYAYWSKLPTLADATNMQDLKDTDYCTGTTIGDTATLTDSRDGTSYTVGKLADGKCWMLDNLALDLTDSTILSNLSSDNTNASTGLPYLKGTSTGTTSDKYATAAVSNWTSSYSYSAPLVNMTNKDIVPTSYNGTDDPMKDAVVSGNWKIGGYYNYCAASAGSYCYGNGTSYGTSSGNATEDICPAGWRMPTGDPSGEYQALYSNSSYNTYANYRAALHLPLSGYFYSGSPNYQGSYGCWWSSTRYANRNSYHLYASTSTIYPANIGYRYYGYSLRCVASS